MRFKCKHILLSHKDAENSSHERALGVAMEEAEAIIKKLKTGEIKFEETARRHSACLSGPSAGGELGWQEEEHFHPDFSNAVRVIPIDQIGPPIISPWGVQVVWRTG
jgi:parvulin-like peptidyl-prolyl isomerase